MPSVIALDAMGSDRSPRPEIEGAIQAARQLGTRVLLIGQEDHIRRELGRHRWISQLPIEVVHASEVITMEDKAAQAVRTKKQSSMHVGIRLVREGKAAGFVTAGNTGAAMAAAKMILGALPGVDRPALAAVFPTAVGTGAMLLDVGVTSIATLTIWSSSLSWARFISVPSSNAATPGGPALDRRGRNQGNLLTRGSFQLLKQLPLNFVGNVRRTRSL
jgi:glycerol-3-phosphate acyltransferase PlsX